MRERKLRVLTQVAAIAVLLLALSSTSSAQRLFGLHGIGPRLGVSINPDQFHFGGQLDLGDLAPRLMMSPNVEVGVGDNVTVIAAMMDVNYRFRNDWGSWNPYLGGGIGPVFYNFDHGRSDSELGLTMQGGLARRLISRAGYMFLEFKVGVVKTPDVKMTVGWMFGS